MKLFSLDERLVLGELGLTSSWRGHAVTHVQEQEATAVKRCSTANRFIR
jgi:hypothetical protein